MRATAAPAIIPPSNLAGQAAMAATGGAAAGAKAVEATERTRLWRIIETVAAQQPRLRWAVGEKGDGTTVLVTDLASGWIPPGIDVPAAVTLLEPRWRRGDCAALLGEVEISVERDPQESGNPVADPEVATSVRPRVAPRVAELGWELNQATRWRDGLPRLVHTLARAVSAGTGVIESEAALLRGELDRVGRCVLDSYPDDVLPHEIGNWQLLATVAALLNGGSAQANYHFAWFMALDSGGVMR